MNTSPGMNGDPLLNELTRQGTARLFPSITDPNWLILRKRRLIFSQWLANMPADRIDVLDVGGRIQPYRALLAGKIRRYVGIDLEQAPLVGVVARGEQLPISDGVFDLVICTQTLAYTSDPAAVLAEMRRVLRLGGRLLLSVPSAAVDAGSERWRWLRTGLLALLSDFRSAEIVAEGTSVAGLFRTINVCGDIFVRHPAAQFAYRRTFCPIVNLAGALFENLYGGANEQFTANYSALAIK